MTKIEQEICKCGHPMNFHLEFTGFCKHCDCFHYNPTPPPDTELREKIAESLHKYNYPTCDFKTCSAKKGYLTLADQILSLLKDAGYVKLAKDQGLPPTRYKGEYTTTIVYANLKEAYYEGQKDMLNAGFRRVE